MRKITVLAAIAMFAALPVFAESAYEKGTVVANIGAGVGIPTNKIEGEKWGKTGFAGEVQGLYFFNEYIGAGAHFGYNWFGEENGLKIKGYNIMADGKFVINPEDTYRVYIPVGIGVAKYKADASFGGMSGTIDSDMTFAYNAGVGVETNITPEIIIGVEGKFNATKFKNDDNGNDVDQDLQYVTAMVKIGYKF